MKFWKKILKNFENCSFNYIIEIKEMLILNPQLKDSLINYLNLKITISNDLKILIKFDLLSNNIKFNLISLFLINNFEISKNFELNPTLELLINSYLNEPKLNFIKKINNEIETPIEIPKELKFSLTNEFFNDLEEILIKFPNQSNEIINKYLIFNDNEIFNKTLSIYFNKDRSINTIIIFFKNYIYPYLKNLNSTPHRLILLILQQITNKYPKICFY